MSIFGNLMSKIFGHAEAAPAPAPGAPAIPATPIGTAAPAGTATAVVDVEAVLTAMAAKNPQKLNWRTSIVDLMKLVGLDSGLPQRKELAKELGYPGSLEDTARMNMWLHQQVLQKLADNGGRVPTELLHK